MLNFLSKLISNDIVRQALIVAWPPAQPWLKLMDFFVKIKDITNAGGFAEAIVSLAVNHESKFNEYLKAFNTSKDDLLKLGHALDSGSLNRQPNITMTDALKRLHSL
jgi:hypothetical protein